MGKIIAMLKKRSVKDYQTTIKMLRRGDIIIDQEGKMYVVLKDCLLYTSPSPRDLSTSRMPSSA